jgi:hypothetical protein
MTPASKMSQAGNCGELQQDQEFRILLVTPERDQQANRPALAKDFGQRAASRVYGKLHPFTVSGVREAGPDVLGCQIREILQNLFLRHSGCEVVQHVIHGYPHPTNARPATAFPRLNGDNVPIIHGATSRVIAAFRLYTTRPGRSISWPAAEMALVWFRAQDSLPHTDRVIE